MTDLLVKIFVKNRDNINDPTVRKRYGTLSSIVGIVCNILLFLLKYLIGTAANSISIISDAFNNLSDCASCCVTLVGYKMASKPADKGHPFGHGRIEYLTALFVSVLILFVGAELFKDSISKIIKPEELHFSLYAVAALLFSIIIKLWMSFFNKGLGNRINSTVMLATAKDSRNDVIATSAALISLIFTCFSGFSLDGYMGLFVSVFILKSGFDVAKDTINEILGKPADPDLVKKIKECVLKNKRIMGIHDLVIHNYGPGNLHGSCHAEVDHKEIITEIHDVIDSIEREIYDKLGVMMTIHMDPVEYDSTQRSQMKQLVEKIINDIDENITFHDFRVVNSDTHINLIFDIVVPFSCKYGKFDVKHKIDEKLKNIDSRFYTIIIFDNSYE